MEPPAQRQAESVEQRSNELEAPGTPGVGLVIGSELVNPDPVSNSAYLSNVLIGLHSAIPSVPFACVCVCVCERERFNVSDGCEGIEYWWNDISRGN
jgi:hypothetical protein